MIRESRSTWALGAIALLGALLNSGCNRSKPGQEEAPPPMVTVAAPVERMVTQYEFASGRTEPLEKVQIRARVSGYLQQILFEPGSEVTKDMPIFEIDPEPFKADLSKAKAQFSTAQADQDVAEAEKSRSEIRVVTTKKEYDRAEKAVSTNAISVSDRDKAKGDYDEAQVAVKSALAKIALAKARIAEAASAVKTAELNLGYCSIKAPITGIIGDKLVTVGNLISGGQTNTTLLTTIVATQKMDIAFDVDEHTLQIVEKGVREGKIKTKNPDEVPVQAGLGVHGSDYPLNGQITFRDNQVDPTTGTIRIKARIDNPKPPSGQRLLTAGMYAHLRIPIGDPVKSMLVPDSALGSDQGIKYLYLVGSDNKAFRMDATIGVLDGEERVILAVQTPGEKESRALSTSDRVIIRGLQRVRPGMVVEPKAETK
jgi:multidrug efflux system membrane fusion protein